MYDLDIRFDINEFAGALGDLGTFVPLVVGMIIVNGMDTTSVMLMFGAFYILSGLLYRLPVPVQPMKAIAILALAGGVSIGVMKGAGLVMGVLFLSLTALGLLDRIERLMSQCVVRGIQLGLGLVLLISSVRLIETPFEVFQFAIPPWIFAVLCIPFAIYLSRRRRMPASFVLLSAGIAPNFLSDISSSLVLPSIHLPEFGSLPNGTDILAALVLLVIPQIPLTIGNSVFATKSLAQTLFPQKNVVTVRKLGFTIGLMNVFSAITGGIPVCHGAGGLAGHYRWGARTGGAPILIGLILLLGGILYGKTLAALFGLIPFPVLGILLLFAALELCLVSARGIAPKKEILIFVTVGLICVFFPYGFAIGLAIGIVATTLMRRVNSRPTMQKQDNIRV